MAMICHDSREFWAVLQTGHTADLNVYAAQRFMSALHKWMGSHAHVGLVESQPCIKALLQCLKRFDCTWHGGRVSFYNGYWSLSDPIAFAPRCAHLLREHWREFIFNTWLNSNRRDAILARQVGIHFTTKLCDELRSRASEQNGHGVAAMCGGIQTDAHWAPGGALRDYCRDCQGAFTPCTDHILWFCRHWSEARTLPRPRCDFLARTGWNMSGVNVRLLHQMAVIRRLATDSRIKRNRQPQGLRVRVTGGWGGALPPGQ